MTSCMEDSALGQENGLNCLQRPSLELKFNEVMSFLEYADCCYTKLLIKKSFINFALSFSVMLAEPIPYPIYCVTQVLLSLGFED